MNRLVVIACLCIGIFTGIVFLKVVENRFFMVEQTNDKSTIASDLSRENSLSNNHPVSLNTINNSKAMAEIESLKATVITLQNTITMLQSEIREIKNSKSDINKEEFVSSSKDNKLNIDKNTLIMDENTLTMDENQLNILQKEEEHRFFSQVANNFYSEPIDYGWSSSVTDRIKSTLTNETASSLIINYIECRSSMCRLEITATDSNIDLEAFKRDFRYRISDVLMSGAVQQDEMGKLIMYLGKDNEAFTRSR